MDNKELVQKVLKGEDIAESIKDFTDEQKTALNLEIAKAADEAASNNLKKLKGTEKEVERREGKDKEGKDNTVLDQFREEQVQKAKSRFYADPRFPLTEAEKSTLEATFARIDSGKVDSDLIFEDLMASFAVVKKSDLFTAKEKATKFEKDAATYNGADSGAQGSISEEDASKYPKAAQDLFMAWQKAGMTGKNYTLERAAKVASQGMSRTL